MGVGSTDDDVSLQPSVSDLAADVSVRDTDDHAVLGSVVFVLGLDDQTLPGIVVGLALAAPAELDLEPLEVSLVFDDFNVDLEGQDEMRVSNWSWFIIISRAKGQIRLVTFIQ